MFAALMDGGEKIERTIVTGALCLRSIARGKVSLNGTPLARGDGAMLTAKTWSSIRARKRKYLFSSWDSCRA